jgi:hypothetical protein
MTITGEITIGNLLTAVSVLISAAALAYGWRKDRQLRRTEHADRIRRAAGVVAAKLERWQSVVLQVFDEVQPLLLDLERATDLQENVASVRYGLLRGLYELRAAASQRIFAEQLETAYIDLYGYDPRIHDLFLTAVRQLQELDERAFGQLCALAGQEVVAPPTAQAGSLREAIGDDLRRQCQGLAAV